MEWKLWNYEPFAMMFPTASITATFPTFPNNTTNNQIIMYAIKVSSLQHVIFTKLSKYQIWNEISVMKAL